MVTRKDIHRGALQSSDAALYGDAASIQCCLLPMYDRWIGLHLGIKRRSCPVYHKTGMRAVIIHMVLRGHRAGLQDVMELLALLPADVVKVMLPHSLQQHMNTLS